MGVDQVFSIELKGLGILGAVVAQLEVLHGLGVLAPPEQRPADAGVGHIEIGVEHQKLAPDSLREIVVAPLVGIQGGPDQQGVIGGLKDHNTPPLAVQNQHGLIQTVDGHGTGQLSLVRTPIAELVEEVAVVIVGEDPPPVAVQHAVHPVGLDSNVHQHRGGAAGRRGPAVGELHIPHGDGKTLAPEEILTLGVDPADFDGNSAFVLFLVLRVAGGVDEPLGVQIKIGVLGGQEGPDPLALFLRGEAAPQIIGKARRDPGRA